MSTEAILQQTFVHMFRTLYPDLILNLSLNGISLNGLSALNKAQVIAQAKREGMETGIPDLTIYLPEGKVLNLEFKRPNGGVQSEDQKKVEAKLLALVETPSKAVHSTSSFLISSCFSTLVAAAFSAVALSFVIVLLKVDIALSISLLNPVDVLPKIFISVIFKD